MVALRYSDESPEAPALERAMRQRALRSGRYSGRSADDLAQALYRSELLLEKQIAELKELRQGIRQESQRAAQAEQGLQAQSSLYEHQTARVEKFKSAYEALKSSPEYRLARAASAPARRAKRLARRRTRKPLPPGHDGQQTTPVSTLAIAAESSDLPRTERIAQAKRLYFQDGLITEPARLVADIGEFPDRGDQVFVNQVCGAERLLLGGLPVIPERQPNPGYQTERGRVLYCAHSTGEFNSNGYSTRTAGLTKAMAETGDVVVVARPGYPWDAKTTGVPDSESRFEREINGLVHVFNPGPSIKDQPLDLYFQHAADVIVREAIVQRASIIHAASNHLTALPALIAARRLGLPFAYEVRGLWEVTEASTKPEWDGSERFALAVALETLVARSADQVLAITEQVRKELIRRGVEGERIGLLPNASDPFEFVPLPVDREISRRLGLEDRDIVVGYAGSILEYEGLELLVEAFSVALALRPELRLVIVGDGPALPGLRSLAHELGTVDRITFVGRVAAADVPRYLSAMDIVACPRLSTPVTEMVSPLKPLEAMSAGRSVLVSDVAPLVDLVGTSGDRGRIFPAGDTGAFAEQIIDLADTPELRANLGRAARQWVLDNRSWAAMARFVQACHVRLAEQVEAGRIVNRQLSDVTVALVSDEFTRSSLEPECRTVFPHPDTWRRQFDELSIDALIVESAWEGNEGTWRGKIGYYDEESFADLRAMVDYCGDKGIPTFFWNKEDPIHFSRYRQTAAIFDHVFTTDADMIPNYFEHRGKHNISIGSLPFWAQPRTHNPLPGTRAAIHTAAYGGTYYGARYPERSRVLATLLRSVMPHGITIYDRQANLPETPYHFPEELAEYVQGGLSYPEMVQAYKAHPIHLNVNSVTKSPTMFSRRVVELAATGTPVISGPGKGVDTIFGGLVPTPESESDAGLIAELWMDDETERNADAWILHRYSFRTHLAGHRLAYMLRSAGIKVAAPELPNYCLQVPGLDAKTVDAILEQTHRPQSVLAPDLQEVGTQDAARRLEAAGIRVVWGDAPPDEATVVGWLGDGVYDRTSGEDLCRALEFHQGTVQIDESDIASPGKTLWEWSEPVADAPRMTWMGTERENRPCLSLRRKIQVRPAKTPEQPLAAAVSVGHEPRRVLVAGHDLKFAGGFMEWLRGQGHSVDVDVWSDHSHHDAVRSGRLLAAADTVFCEWSLGNIEWYAQHRRANQRLTSRFHSQELFTPHLYRLDVGLVDHTIFVGELVRQVAIRRFGYDEAKTSVVPNALGVSPGQTPIDANRRFTLGLVGMVPRQKHLDRALALLAQLRTVDRRYTLRVKGRRPEEYPWMIAREHEMDYYRELSARIKHDPLIEGAVFFDPHGDDMSSWYGGIGMALSVSDFESFHLTLADGAASGALPFSLAWPGAECIYPRDWLFRDIGSMGRASLRYASDPDAFVRAAADAQEFARRKFGAERVFPTLGALILGPS